MSWDDYSDVPYCARCFQLAEKCTCKGWPDIKLGNPQKERAIKQVSDDLGWKEFLRKETDWKREYLGKWEPPKAEAFYGIERSYSITESEMKKRRKAAAEQGYYDGQADALSFLWGDVGVDDDPCAPCHRELTWDFKLFCLGINITTAAALKRAECNGKTAAQDWNRGVRRRWN